MKVYLDSGLIAFKDNPVNSDFFSSRRWNKCGDIHSLPCDPVDRNRKLTSALYASEAVCRNTSVFAQLPQQHKSAVQHWVNAHVRMRTVRVSGVGGPVWEVRGTRVNPVVPAFYTLAPCCSILTCTPIKLSVYMDCRARLRKQVRRAKRVATRDSKSNDISSQPSGGCYPDVPAWVTTLFVAKVSINRQQGNASPQDFPIGSATGHQQRFVCVVYGITKNDGAG